MDNYGKQDIDLTDDELIDGYLNGDTSYFNQLLDRHKTRLFDYIYRHIGGRQEAEDIFQEVFYRAINNLKYYRKEGRFRAWLFKIALNICIDHIRKKRKITVVSLNQQFFNEETEGASLEAIIVSDSPSPSKTVNDKEVEKLLQEAIECLSGEQKSVLCLRIYAGLSFREISQALGCSINTVLARMHYALRNLRNKLKERGVLNEL